MKQKIDSRVIKTQAAIQNSFWELLDEEGFAKIKVKQILQRADINRSTFYTYYDDKYALLDTVEEELFEGFRNIGRQMSSAMITVHRSDLSSIRDYYNQMANYIYRNGKKIALLVCDEGDPAFVSKLITMDRDFWRQTGLIEKLAIPQRYAFSAFAAMIVSLITEWAKSDFHETSEEFSKIMDKVISPVMLTHSLFSE